MFTIEARVDKTYDLAVPRKALRDFFADPENFSRYMSEIISDVEPQKSNRSIWTLTIEISSGSSLTVKLDMEAKQSGDGNLSYEPVRQSEDHLAIFVDMDENGSRTEVHFILEMRLQRKSSFDIHPLAGFLGERSINKLTQRYGEEYVDQFLSRAEAEIGGKGGKKKK
jgi:hypothetical protein